VNNGFCIFTLYIYIYIALSTVESEPVYKLK